MGMTDKQFAVMATRMYLDLKKALAKLNKLDDNEDIQDIREILEDEMTSLQASMDGFVPKDEK
jgi:hypothetical protein